MVVINQMDLFEITVRSHQVDLAREIPNRDNKKQALGRKCCGERSKPNGLATLA